MSSIDEIMLDNLARELFNSSYNSLDDDQKYHCQTELVGLLMLADELSKDSDMPEC